MEHHQTLPDSVRASAENYIRAAVDRGLQEAFAAGYAQGANDALKRVMAAAASEVATVSPPSALPPVRERARPDLPQGREVHPNSAEARRFPYGAVSDAFRQALKRAGVFGTTHADLIASVSLILGVDVSAMNHRDTMKRLKKAREMRVHEGRYFPGPALTRNENGAPATLPLGAPEAGEGATSPNDSQSIERLIG